MYPKIPIELGDDIFCFRQTGDKLSLNVNCNEPDDERGSSGPVSPVPVDCSFGGLLLEELDWLQKRKNIQLCHTSEDGSLKVKIVIIKHNINKSTFFHYFIICFLTAENISSRIGDREARIPQ